MRSYFPASVLVLAMLLLGSGSVRAAPIEMPTLDIPRPFPEYTLVVIPDFGKVYELDRDGKPRWEIAHVESVFDAQVLPGGRVLVAEYTGRVTERNLKGEILWEKKVDGALQCRRLANGNTFIVSTKQIIEVDPAGKERVVYAPGISLIAARKLPGGQLVLVDGRGDCIRLDSAGKELNRFAVGKVSSNCLDVLPNGHVLIPKFFDGRVTEYDDRGKVVWEVKCPSAFSAQRLPNGNTLVACHDPARVVELDLDGKVVWEHKTEDSNHKPWFASRR